MRGSSRGAVIWLHGLGDSGNGWRFLERQVQAALRGKQVVWTFPTAPTVPVTCNGGMEMNSWCDLCTIPVAPGQREDPAGLSRSVETVHDLINTRVADGTSPDNIVVGGFSQGGAIALLAAYTYEAPLGGCVVFSGFVQQREQILSHLAKGEVNRTPALVVHGTRDDVVLSSCGGQVHQLLESAGVQVTAVTFGMGHEAHPDQFVLLGQFLTGITPEQEAREEVEGGPAVR